VLEYVTHGPAQKPVPEVSAKSVPVPVPARAEAYGMQRLRPLENALLTYLLTDIEIQFLLNPRIGKSTVAPVLKL
jgi:hypothetical protein